jgi:TldD protein
MSDILLAKKTLWEPTALSEEAVGKALWQLSKKNTDECDLYFQERHIESFVLEEGIIKEASLNTSSGMGARVVRGEKTGFAYTENLSASAIEKTAKMAASLLEGSTTEKVQSQFIEKSGKAFYPSQSPLSQEQTQEKIALLLAIDKYTRTLDKRIIRVNANLVGSYDQVLMLNEKGELSSDSRPLIRLNISVIVEDNGKREQASMGGGGRYHYDYFLKSDIPFDYAREAVRVALLNLSARSAPAGMMPIVMGAGWSGVLLHEAIGHGLEGDFNRKGLSAFSGRIGEKVASEYCTVIDDGTIADRRGSLNRDDEGQATEKTVLIEKGILKGYLQDRQNARLMKTASTGNGRRESYRHLPMPRMTNTYFAQGTHTQAEMIESIERGIFVVGLGGGSVDITSGKFVFSTTEAYLIEKGKVTTPIKGATLIGSGPEVMQKISMMGDDWALDSGVGTCGKDGQHVPVGVGQPSLKVDEMVVGGTGQ